MYIDKILMRRAIDKLTRDQLSSKAVRERWLGPGLR